jgi:crotonobetainyl-CoA:carnitine CoA-transferase CaiB-like acyl-CoA transferase
MGALDGVKVADFGQWIAGPLAAMLLGDQGAEVVTRLHTDGTAVTTIGPPARLSRTPVVPGRLAPPPGADAEEVLASIGMAGRLGDLVQQRALALE